MGAIPFHPALLRSNTASLNKRLWQVGGWLAVMLFTFAIGNLFLSDDKALTRRMVGFDFTAFYSAGTLVREGKLDQLYSITAINNLEHAIWARDGYPPSDSYGPWWNPPFYAWVFVPLSRLSLPNAIAVWSCITLTCLAIAITLLCRMLIEARTADQTPITIRQWGLVPLLMVVSMPFVQVVSHGQNSFMSLLLMTLTVYCWRSGRSLLAGVVCGTLFYKPQLGAVLGAVLVLHQGYKALLGIAMTGCCLLLITIITLPGTLTDYLHRLPGVLHYMQVERPYMWDRHATVKAFWRLLLQGKTAGPASSLVTALTLLITGGLGIGLVQTCRRTGIGFFTQPGNPDALIISALLCMPLLMPFYFDYDLMLLSIPTVLLTAQRIQQNETSQVDDWLVRCWIVLFLWLPINPGFADRTHVNVTVLLLSFLAILAIRRARIHPSPIDNSR